MHDRAADLPPTSLGVLGTGAIAEALVTGLCSGGGVQGRVRVSARNRQRSSRLAARFEQIEVIEDSQAILDRCDRLLIAVRPEQLESTLAPLHFRADHVVLSLVAGVSLEQLGMLCAPALRIHRAIPMPPVERREGPLPLVPPDAALEAFLAPLGTVLPVRDERLFQALAAASAVMASHFELVATTARWLEAQGEDRKIAADYATSLFAALAGEFRGATPDQLAGLGQECLTKGGLNEQVLRELRERDWFTSVEGRLDRILARLLDS